MEIKIGQIAKVYCLSDKPEGKVVSIGANSISIEIAKGVLVVDKDDIVTGPNQILQVLNFSSIKENVKITGEIPEKFGNMPQQFANDMMDTINAISGNKEKNMHKIFMHYLRNSSNNDFFPIPCVFDIKKDGHSGIGMAGIAVSIPEVFFSVAAILKKEKPKELMFGIVLNNMTKGNIDKKFKEVFCLCRVKNDRWMYGVVGYNEKKDLDKELDWDNQFWIEKIKALMGSAGLIPIEKKIGTAYNQKIQIKKWIESPAGYHYEGDVIIEKLDEKTKLFLKDKNLDPNNREQILKYFEDNDMKLDFMDSTDSVVNLMVSNQGFLFMDRKSKTRAILEAIEAIANKK